MSGLTRRDAIKAAMTAAAVGATAGWLGPNSAYGAAATRQEQALATAPFIPYTANSFFRSQVLGIPVDAVRTTAFHTFMKTHPDQKSTSYPKINGLGSNMWGTAWAEGSASDPVWKLTGTVPKDVAILKVQGFHAPEWFGDMFSGTNDSPFVCLDRGTGISVWAANAKVVGPHLISVSAAGYFEHASNGLDKRNPLSTSDVNFRSRGAIPDGMVIRRDVVDWAIAHNTGLGHVLHMFLVETDGLAGFCNPMVGCESRQRGWGIEGERIAIRQDIDLTKRGLSPFGLVVARTLQDNGCYFGDNSGSQTALKAEQISSSRNPWSGMTASQDALAGHVTWDDFDVIRKGL